MEIKNGTEGGRSGVMPIKSENKNRPTIKIDLAFSKKKYYYIKKSKLKAFLRCAEV